MTDPFDQLRGASSGASPNIDAIRLRAHRIRRRRQTGLAGAGAAAMAIIAVVGVLLATGPDGEKASTSLAQELRSTTAPTQAPPRALAGRVADSEPASKPVSGGAVRSGSGAPVTGSAPAEEGQTTSSDAGVAAAKGAPAPELEATLEIEEQTIGRGKTFTLKVCNVTSGTVKRSFGTSQRYDFEVSREGKLVWRWSDGQFFTQVVGDETWKAKECKTWSESWDATDSEGSPVATGDYEAVGILKAQPELRTSPSTTPVSTL